MSLDPDMLDSVAENLPITQEFQRFESDPFMYNGELVKRIIYQTSGQTIRANSTEDFTLENVEVGEILYFNVAVNDPLIAIKCTIFDSKEGSTVINDVTMRRAAVLGRGMTLGEAETLVPDGIGGFVSADRSGKSHTTVPYLSRYKHTFSLSSMKYVNVKGTDDDRWIVLEYAPVLPVRYNRMIFAIENSSSEDRMIHNVSLNRIRFLVEGNEDILSRKQIQDTKASYARKIRAARARISR